MKNLLITFLLLISSSIFADIYNFDLKNTKGELLSFKNFKGKTLLIVNIATRCGYTGQLDELESLYQKYKKKGLIIIGVPSNDFGSQTPESNKEVAKFCRLKYGVNFPLSSKVALRGNDKPELYSYLIQKTGGREISWNFEKFLINSNGKVVSRFSSSTLPLSSRLDNAIKEALE